MISEFAWMDRTLAGLLLLACACGGSEGARNTPPLPSEPPDAATTANGPSPGPDAGLGESSSGEMLPPDASAPSDEPAASDDPAGGIDLELACSSGQAQAICLDEQRVVICLGGSPIETGCGALCDSYGRDTGPCNEGCQCGEPFNATCVKASEDFCACTALTGNEPCTPDTLDRLYLACYVNGIGGELMKCTADFRATQPDAPVDAAFCAGLDDACD